MAYEDWLDESPTVNNYGAWRGFRVFTPAFYEKELAIPKPTTTGPITVRLRGRPDGKGGIHPFLVTKKNQQLYAEVGDLYTFSCAFQLNLVEFFGPKPPEDDKDNVRLCWIDDWHPAKRREYRNKGESLPPMFASLMVAKAPIVSRQQSRFMGFWSNKDLDNPVQAGTPRLFLPVVTIEDPNDDKCSVDNPSYGVMRVKKSGMRSLREFVLKERENYVMPENATHEMLDTREALRNRFVVPDLVDPAGAPVITFTYKRSGSKKEGSRYVCSLKYEPGSPTPTAFALPVELQAEKWLEPDEMFLFMTPEEQRDFALEMSWNNDWADFILQCLKGTYLEVTQSVRGVDVAPADPMQSDMAVMGQVMGDMGVPTAELEGAMVQHEQPATQALGAQQPEQQVQALGAQQPRTQEEPPPAQQPLGAPQQSAQPQVSQLPPPDQILGEAVQNAGGAGAFDLSGVKSEAETAVTPPAAGGDAASRAAAAEAKLRELMGN